MRESQIIIGCKKRERKAQKAFVDVFSPYIYTICRRYVIEDFIAQDCLQDSLVQVLKNIDKYENSGSFKSWVSKVTVRKCLEYLRRNKKYIYRELEVGLVPIHEENVFLKLEVEDVMKFMQTLPYNYRTALNMYLVEGYSHKEIGVMLNVTESSSRSLVTRARKMIKENFKSERLNIVHKRTDDEKDLGGRSLMVK